MIEKGAFRVAFMDDHLSNGGTTVNLLRLLPRMELHGFHAMVLASDVENDMGALFFREGIDLRIYRFGTARDLYDDRVLGAYRHLAAFAPHAVVASHETVSFDLLRYVPAGVFRVAEVQTDDEWSYGLVGDYAPWIDAAVCVSRLVCRRSTDRVAGYPVDVVHIPNGANPPSSLPVRSPGEPGLRVLYIGRLVEQQKRISRFIPIWQELCRRDVPVLWTFVGDGSERNVLENGMRSSARQKVLFTGNVSPDQIRAYCQSHDVITLVSDYEGLAIAVLEGMASGLVPVVTEQRGEWPDMIDSNCGFCVKPDDPVAFVDVLVGLRPESESFAALRRASFDKIRGEFSHDRRVANWVNLIRDNIKTEDPVWPSSVPFLGPPYTAAAGCRGIRRRLYYHPALRPLRRVGHRVISAMERCFPPPRREGM